MPVWGEGIILGGGSTNSVSRESALMRIRRYSIYSDYRFQRISCLPETFVVRYFVSFCQFYFSNILLRDKTVRT